LARGFDVWFCFAQRYAIVNIARFELTGNDKSCFVCRRITLRMELTNTGGYKKHLIVITVND